MAALKMYTLSLHDALPIYLVPVQVKGQHVLGTHHRKCTASSSQVAYSCLLANLYLEEPGDSLSERSEEHTSELQSRENLVCRLLLEKKKTIERRHSTTQDP